MKGISRHWRNSRSQGFTLVEIVFAVAILGLVAGLAVPNVMRAMRHARINSAEQELARLAAAVEKLTWDTGQWPGGKSITLPPQQVAQRYNDLTLPEVGIRGNDGRFVNWSGPYIDYVPLDPWGEPYFFDSEYRQDSIGPRFTVVGSRGPGSGSLGTQRYGPHTIIHSLDHIYQRTR